MRSLPARGLRSALLATAFGLTLTACSDTLTQPDPLAPDAARSAAMAGVEVSATGSGHFRWEGSKRTFAFTGTRHADGRVSGQFQLRTARARIHGTVTCMRVVENEAWFGALGRDGFGWAFRVRDGGEGPGSQDMISYAYRWYPGFAQQFCDEMPGWAFLVPIDVGEVQVRSTGPRPTVVYSEDFERATGPEWSVDRRSTSPSGATYLGDFSDADYHEAVLSATGLPPHSALRVTFDVYILGTMDGNQTEFGLDLFTFGERSTGFAFQTTFSGYGGAQAFPAAYGAGEYFDYPGASAINSLGYLWQGHPMDVIYPVTLVIPHSDPSAELYFGAEGLQDYLDPTGTFFSDESWGIDNVEVAVIR